MGKLRPLMDRKWEVTKGGGGWGVVLSDVFVCFLKIWLVGCFFIFLNHVFSETSADSRNFVPSVSPRHVTPTQHSHTHSHTHIYSGNIIATTSNNGIRIEPWCHAETRVFAANVCWLAAGFSLAQRHHVKCMTSDLSPIPQTFLCALPRVCQAVRSAAEGSAGLKLWPKKKTFSILKMYVSCVWNYWNMN